MGGNLLAEISYETAVMAIIFQETPLTAAKFLKKTPVAAVVFVRISAKFSTRVAATKVTHLSVNLHF